MSRKSALLGVLVLSAAGVAAQETAPAGPPRVLAISREEIKPGRMTPHEKVAASFVAAISKANLQNYRLGLTPVSGDDNQVVYLEGFDSFAAVEASRKAMDEALAGNAAFKADFDLVERQGADMHATQKTAYAIYREDLSYRPLKVGEVAKSRYFNVVTVRVKPGQMTDYADYTKQYNTAREKANTDAHTAVYQVVTGAPTGTFLIFVAHRSLSEWDDFIRTMDARDKAINEALGGEAVVKQRRAWAAEIISDNFSTLYAFSPAISRANPQFAAADPDFWSPKPKAPAKALASKKETPKP